MDSYSEFLGKKVVITGAAGIYGQWIAEAFAAEGAELLLTDIREEELERQAEKLKGVPVTIHPSDLTDSESIQGLVQKVEALWGAPDIIINNAGIYPRHFLLKMSIEEWDKSMGINVRAPFFLTQQLTRLMIQREIPGSVINLVSGASKSVQIGGGHYSTAKAALSMLTRAFSLELAPFNIRVNAVGPGFSPGSEVSLLADDYIDNMVKSIPLGRTSGPHDAPQAILFLCSDKASFITGATLDVDGGRTAGKFNVPERFKEVILE
ncbi:beta-ketoacyl-ACP reductase [Pullulanibacillus camelliae]|uniref:Beta-ketoacyl-ACP reductase n=1 Tax=Pullulanibacillus camelliae TaxID=1707096 RepID=A0A8J2VGG6_9BACL|nr:SDR family oxidoreductase [Pullulanibacillus camelliae]GGE27007.1 beta-ketoacyl-ACP reductase [Pullulanibacillus camelliae]